MIKRTLATTAASVALIGGSALVAAPATAAPYPDSVRSYIGVTVKKNPIKSGKRAKVVVRVKSGTGKPRGGKVSVTFGNRTITKNWNGNRKVFKSQKLFGKKNKARTVQVKVRYTAPKKSVYRDSKADTRIKVLKRKRR